MIPERSNTEACTKRSLPPRSGAMKPNPLLALYHFTVPISSTVVRSAEGWYAGRSGLGRLGCSCVAVLASTLRISVTCGPFGPGMHLERRAGRHAAVASALNYAHMEECIAGTVGQLDEAEALSGLYHLTVARTSGPEGLSNCG